MREREYWRADAAALCKAMGVRPKPLPIWILNSWAATVRISPHNACMRAAAS